jgi:hypothetical protein
LVANDLYFILTTSVTSSVEETKDLSSSLLSPSFLMGHDSVGGRDQDMSELTRWEEVYNPLLNFIDANVESRRDNSALVETSIEFYNNFVGTVIIDNFEFTNVSFGSKKGKR